MARHKSIARSEVFAPELDISSLIDVCFLLLIYFIVTSTITPREQDLGLALPSDQKVVGRKPPIPPMVIRIDAQGIVISGIGSSEQVLDADADSRDLPLLCAQLELYSAAAKSVGDVPSVMLSVDENIRQQRLIDVLNAFAATGITSVAFNELNFL